MRMLDMTVIYGFCLFQLLGCASGPEREISDHFDGKKFFNPTLTEQFSPGFSDVFRMVKDGRAEWPDHVENLGVPRLDVELGPNDIALTFVNHATFLIQFSGLNILTDPVWSDRLGPSLFGIKVGPKRVRAPGVKIEDLPKIDVIVISHNHYDHLDIETLKKINDRFSPKVLVPLGHKSLIESIGIKDVQELDWWESVKINPDIHITLTPGQHSSRRGLFDLDRSLWGGYFIQHGERGVYFDGDSGYSTHYAEINKQLGSPDIALLGVGAYLPRWFMKSLHMNPAEAVVAHKNLGAKLSIGMHSGTFQLSAEAFDQPSKDLKKALEQEGLLQGCFIFLYEGETKIY
jgi:L-ascorbate metabolism protein UlaG (beta-lactamase superfamily)